MADSESDTLVSRFRPEQRARVAVDLKREDDLLREYIEAGKLDFWFQNLLSSIEHQTQSKNTAQPESSDPADMPSIDSKAKLTWV